MSAVSPCHGFYRRMDDPHWIQFANGRVKVFATHQRLIEELTALIAIVESSPWIDALTTEPQ